MDTEGFCSWQHVLEEHSLCFEHFCLTLYIKTKIRDSFVLEIYILHKQDVKYDQSEKNERCGGAQVTIGPFFVEFACYVLIEAVKVTNLSSMNEWMNEALKYIFQKWQILLPNIPRFSI